MLQDTGVSFFTFFTCNQKKNIAMDNQLNVDVKMVENMSRQREP